MTALHDWRRYRHSIPVRSSFICRVWSLSVQRRRSLREPSLWTCVSWRWPGKSGSSSVPTWTKMAWRLCGPHTAWCWWLWPEPSTGMKLVWASLNRCLVSSGHRWWTTAGRSRMSTWRSKVAMHLKVQWLQRLLWVTVLVNCSFSAVDDVSVLFTSWTFLDTDMLWLNLPEQVLSDPLLYSCFAKCGLEQSCRNLASIKSGMKQILRKVLCWLIKWNNPVLLLRFIQNQFHSWFWCL